MQVQVLLGMPDLSLVSFCIQHRIKVIFMKSAVNCACHKFNRCIIFCLKIIQEIRPFQCFCIPQIIEIYMSIIVQQVLYHTSEYRQYFIGWYVYKNIYNYPYVPRGLIWKTKRLNLGFLQQYCHMFFAVVCQCYWRLLDWLRRMLRIFIFCHIGLNHGCLCFLVVCWYYRGI